MLCGWWMEMHSENAQTTTKHVVGWKRQWNCCHMTHFLMTSIGTKSWTIWMDFNISTQQWVECKVDRMQFLIVFYHKILMVGIFLGIIVTFSFEGTSWDKVIFGFTTWIETKLETFFILFLHLFFCVTHSLRVVKNGFRFESDLPL